MPQLEVLALAPTDLVIVLFLGDSWSISFIHHSTRLEVRRNSGGSKPLVSKHLADVLLELKDDLLYLDAHILLLDAF